MRGILWLIPACLFAQTAPDALTGNWINDNSKTGGITQVIVRIAQNRMLVHAWGSCTPTDCDWGEAEAKLWNGTRLATWDHGFSTVRMQLVPQPDGRLLVAYRDEYHDNSGRTGHGAAEFFTRESARAERGDAATMALIRQVAETYAGLRTARFEMDETVNRVTGNSERRTVTHYTTLYAAPGRVRMEVSGAGEPTITISDGKSQWRTFPGTNEYTVVPQGKDDRPFRFYALLDQDRSPARILGREQFQGADCTVLEVAERGATHKLWIDNTSHLVRKELSDEPPSVKREMVFTTIRTDESFSPELFSYDPSKMQAKNRQQLAREAPRTMTGAPAPDLTLRDLDGREVRLSDLRGKVVLLDFWATWCGYCREALPMIELLHRGLKDKGLAVFGVDSEAPELAREYLAKYGYTMASLVDTRNEAVSRYRVESWPTTILIDREGRIAYYQSGHEPEKLRDAMRALGVW